MKRFPSDSAPKEFTTILELVDFIYSGLIELKELLARATNNHYERHKNFSEDFQIADNLVIEKISPLNDEIANRIKLIKAKMVDSYQNKYNLGFVFASYYKPLEKLLTKEVDYAMLTPLYKGLVYEVSKGIDYYEQVIDGYNQFTTEVILMKAGFDKYLTLLKEQTVKICQIK